MKLQTIDIETIGRNEGDALKPWEYGKNSWILCMGVWLPLGNLLFESNFFIPDHVMPLLPQQFDRLDQYIDKKAIICGWNLKFDLAFLYASGVVFNNRMFLDGIVLLQRLADHNKNLKQKSYGLKQTLEIYKEHIPNYISGYAEDVTIPMTPEDITPQRKATIALYCQRDVYYTQKLVEYLISISPKQVLRSAIYESTVKALFARSLVVGQRIDKTRLQEMIDTNIAEIKGLEIKLGLENITSKIIKSPKQLTDKLSELGFIGFDKTDKGGISVNKVSLKKVINKTNNNILKDIARYKELLTENNKFLIPALSLYVSHADIAYGTYTGRMTYSCYITNEITRKFKNGKEKKVKVRQYVGLPLHQMKRGQIRSIALPPEGYKLVEIDFSGQEMRLMAAIAEEHTMLSLFNSGADLHSFTGASIAGVKYEVFQEHPEFKHFRQLGKTVNLSLQYRLSAAGLLRVLQASDIKSTIEEAMMMREKYLTLYPKIKEYWSKQTLVARGNYVSNMVGRKHWFDRSVEVIRNGIKKVRSQSDMEWDCAQQAINYPIQSTGAEQKILFLYCAQPYMQENGIVLGWDLHDGIYFYVPESNAEELGTELANIASNLDYEKFWDWKPQIKFPVELKIGSDWGNLRKITL